MLQELSGSLGKGPIGEEWGLLGKSQWETKAYQQLYDQA